MDATEFAHRYVVRFDDLRPSAASAGETKPPCQSERLTVVGEASERPDAGVGVNLAYLRCEPNEGFSSPSYPGWEVLMPMNGRWRITVENREDVELGPWDTVVIPGGTFHSAVNVSDQPAIMLGIDPGSANTGVLAAESIAELAATLSDGGEPSKLPK